MSDTDPTGERVQAAIAVIVRDHERRIHALEQKLEAALARLAFAGEAADTAKVKLLEPKP